MFTGKLGILNVIHSTYSASSAFLYIIFHILSNYFVNYSITPTFNCPFPSQYHAVTTSNLYEASLFILINPPQPCHPINHHLLFPHYSLYLFPFSLFTFFCSPGFTGLLGRLPIIVHCSFLNCSLYLPTLHPTLLLIPFCLSGSIRHLLLILFSLPFFILHSSFFISLYQLGHWVHWARARVTRHTGTYI